MGRVFATSDWHGCGKPVRKMMKFLQPDDKVYFIGDAIDRGPDSIELFDLIVADPRFIFLKGNHEDMLADALISEPRTQREMNLFVYNGTDRTMQQLKNLTIEEKQAYIDTIRRMPEIDFYQSPKGHTVFLEHAGFSPFAMPCRTHDALWDRQHFYDEWSNGQTYRHFNPETTYVVHGHTPVQFLKFEYGYKGQGAKSAEELKIGKKWDSPEIDYRPQVIRYCDGHKFDIDMCTIVSGRIALLDLDTFETIYFDE